jgi:single-strand DNA-binding protein
MGSHNQVTLVGHLGRDAEVRHTPGGAPVATFSLATSDVWTDKQGQRQERTEWHRIVLWGKLAESLGEYLRKGKQVLVVGKIQNRDWTDKDDVKRHTTEIRAERIVLLGAAPASSTNGTRHLRDEDVNTGADPAVGEPPMRDDDIPF